MAEAKTESKSSLRLDQLSEVEAMLPPVSMLAALPRVRRRVCRRYGGGAAGAPGFAVERDQADLGGGFLAAASANDDGAVDERQFVIFLEEDDQAIGELDALAAAPA